MAYPDLPKNRLILIDSSNQEIDLTERYRLILSDGYSLGSPVANTKVIEVLGSTSVLDLTESLLGDTSYKERQQTLTLFHLYPSDPYELKTFVFNLLHGKRYKYKFTMEPDYYYIGRFNIDSCAIDEYAIVFSITITADPFKYKPTRVYKINAYHGTTKVFPSGRMTVRPTIESDAVCYVSDGVKEYAVPAGTHQLTKIRFKEGNNTLYFNTKRDLVVKWDDLSQTGSASKKWDEAATYRWDELHSLGDPNYSPKSWDDHKLITWTELQNSKWSDMDHGGSTESYVTITYEWGDL